MTEVDLRRTLPRHLTWLAGLALTWLTISVLHESRLGQDSHAYWAAWRGSMYGVRPGSLDAYNYSPAFAQLIWLPAQPPWPVFGVLFSLVSALALAYLFRPLGWAWVAPLLLCCAPEILSGNVFWVLALVAAFGVRWPALWAFPLLTKITPGLGPLWFACRREWRSLAISLAVTAAVVAVSVATMPGAWAAWLDFLLHHASASRGAVGSDWFPPLVVRLPAAVALVVWAALTDRRWGLPAAMVLATPVAGIAAFTILAALPRLGHAADRARRPRRESVATCERSPQPATTPS